MSEDIKKNERLISLLSQLKNEIEFLREENKILNAKMDIVNTFKMALSGERFNRNMASMPDLLCDVSNIIDLLKEENKNKIKKE